MCVILHLKSIVLFVCLKWITVECHTIPLHEISQNVSSNTLLDLLGVAENVLYSAKQLAKIKIRSDHNLKFPNPMDCAEILGNSSTSKRESGIYQVWLRSRVAKGPINVYCDMDDDGGAWTIIQRRGDFDSLKDYFYRDWISYKNGFGDPRKDFWIGNDNIFSLTNQRSNTVKFTMSDWEGNFTYAAYDDFWMDDEAHNYTMHVAGYRGTAGDGFSFTNGLPFTTKDNDHDKHANNCAVMFKGAWWYSSCHGSNLNGQYLKGAHESYADGVNWSSFRGQHYSLKDTVIKIRPKNFIKNVDLNLTPH